MRKAVAGLALAAAFVACTSDRPDVLPTANGTPTATPTDAADLAALLPGEAPAEYTLVEEQSGPLSLEEAAADADDPETERKRLRENGFLRGYTRTWQHVAGDVIIVIVDEFTTQAGAMREYDASLAEAGETGATRFDVAGIDGAAGLTQDEEGDRFHAVAFVRGNRLFVAAVGGAEGAHRPAEAIDLAREILALVDKAS